MRVMNPPSSPECHARGELRHVTSKDDMRSGIVTPGPRAAALSHCAGQARRAAGNGHAASRSQGGRGMHGEQDGGKISQAYQDHRPYLVDLAFRMLGDIGAAEDIVQDAFTRLMAAKRGEIEDERGWLIVVTSRLCLDQIKSAHSRRERAHDATEIEF